MYQTNHFKVLLDFFSENRNKSYSALELISKFSKTMDKATVYRKLQLLEKNKLIHKTFNPIHHCNEYQYSKDCENHFHLICQSCGEITHLTIDTADLFMKSILEKYNFVIHKNTSPIYGLCKECRKVC